MSRVAIVGVEGSGKTVLMAALADLYGDPSHDSIYLMPESQSSFAFMKHIPHKMRAEHQWPAATTIESFKHLKWSMRIGQKILMDIEMLDYPGELYRMAFGERKEAEIDPHRESIHEFLAHLVDADILVVLFNLSDALDVGGNPRNTETVWLTRGIFEYAKKLPNLKSQLLLFTQADRYREELDTPGGATSAKNKHLPMLHVLFPDLDCRAVSVATDSGATPTAEFSSTYGMSGFMCWLFGQTDEGRSVISAMDAAEKILASKSSDTAALSTAIENINTLAPATCEFAAPNRREHLLKALAKQLQALLLEKCKLLYKKVLTIDSLSELVGILNSYRSTLNQLNRLTDDGSIEFQLLDRHKALCAEISKICDAGHKFANEHQSICSLEWKHLRANLKQPDAAALLARIQSRHIAETITACNADRDYIVNAKPANQKDLVEQITRHFAVYDHSVNRLTELCDALPSAVDECLAKEHKALVEDFCVINEDVPRLLESRTCWSLRKESTWTPLRVKLQSDVAIDYFENIKTLHMRGALAEFKGWSVAAAVVVLIGAIVSAQPISRFIEGKREENRIRQEALKAEEQARLEREAEEQALAALILRAESGDADSQAELARRYINSEGLSFDWEEAARWYRSAAEQGNAVAQFVYGWLFVEDEDASENLATRKDWILRSAEQNHAPAQYRLGMMYHDGDGIPQDNAQAMRWYRLAAEQEDAGAQFNLGVMYAAGEGVSKNAAEAVRWYRLAAEQGHAGAQLNLGVMYDNGDGVSKNAAEAVRWYRLAAEQGHAGAQLNLGLMYYNGDGVSKNAAEAVRWFRLAAEQGDAGARFNLGVMYDNGDGVSKNAAEAVRWYRLAAEQGHAGAQLNLGVMYDNGDGVSKNAAEAVRWFRLAAEQGDAGAQFNLGLMYANGDGVSKNAAEAVRWYRLAAEQGHAGAQLNLGVMYDNGDGVSKDAAEAVRWYSLAAEQGHAGAQFNLGVMYDNGDGVSKDAAEAVRWYSLAAEQGHAGAQFNLGVMYANGDGVSKDAAEAVRWYSLAAEQGYAGAQFNLGVMYANGDGVSKDAAEAVRWYSLAAEQGHAGAQFNFGLMYAKGDGVPQDLVEAARRFRLAAEQGHAGAQYVLGMLYAEGEVVPMNRAEAASWFRKAARQEHVESRKWLTGNGYTW
jgi:TPR repeat protein